MPNVKFLFGIEVLRRSKTHWVGRPNQMHTWTDEVGVGLSETLVDADWFREA